MDDNLQHKHIDVFILYFDAFFCSVILIPVADRLFVIVVMGDSALCHGWASGIAHHVGDDLFFPVLHAVHIRRGRTNI